MGRKPLARRAGEMGKGVSVKLGEGGASPGIRRSLCLAQRDRGGGSETALLPEGAT
jgi:hypothetical protein